MKSLTKKIFTYLLIGLFATVFTYSVGPYGCRSECKMCSVECQCSQMNASEDNNELNLANNCNQMGDTEVLNLLLYEQIYQRTFKPDVKYSEPVYKTGTTDIHSNNLQLKTYSYPEHYHNPFQDNILKTTQLLI